MELDAFSVDVTFSDIRICFLSYTTAEVGSHLASHLLPFPDCVCRNIFF